ncbi:relaxase/mobilization nuclease domain-containing protein [uncultured Pedobacter sp.]|uniref:relaxase/mobilization nuclease domain-containing protein n=1 Tax=uncultured Pedobacter sp. TaxID=246139 RepID=UPI002624AB11|nr:relaxase/mobilization nuclease domain-containing protein [uncultured Pedobacter sp.]
MVAVIGSGVSIRRAFLYNENKLDKGQAKCLMLANYPLDLQQTDKGQRLNMLLRTAQLNPDVARPSIHISLNFAPEEKLSDATLCKIASDYMKGIGFDGQPFLVYRHDDAAHPHIHIVTTKIRPDGTRIDTQNIGKLYSEPTRKALEIQYGLVRAEDQKEQLQQLRPVDASKVIYGKITTKRAIAGVLQKVLKNYRYSSFSELNAVLAQYNIRADRGTEGSRINRHDGLIYQVLDPDGKPIGMPIKASAFYNNPGVKFLQDRFEMNQPEKQKHREKLGSTIDLILLRNPKIDLYQFADRLRKEAIHLAIRQNEEGRVYGLTYVDHRTKCVFNGSDLGKKYSASGIAEKLSIKEIIESSITKKLPASPEDNDASTTTTKQLKGTGAPDSTMHSGGHVGFIDDLMQPEFTDQQIPYPFRRRKKKKKKR